MALYQLNSGRAGLDQLWAAGRADDCGSAWAPPGLLRALTSVFNLAVSERVEKAIYNSALQARTATAQGDHTHYVLPTEKVVALLKG